MVPAEQSHPKQHHEGDRRNERECESPEWGAPFRRAVEFVYGNHVSLRRLGGSHERGDGLIDILRLDVHDSTVFGSAVVAEPPDATALTNEYERVAWLRAYGPTHYPVGL
jgi:hypothetical protein